MTDTVIAKEELISYSKQPHSINNFAARTEFQMLRPTIVIINCEASEGQPHFCFWGCWNCYLFRGLGPSPFSFPG